MSRASSRQLDYVDDWLGQWAKWQGGAEAGGGRVRGVYVGDTGSAATGGDQNGTAFEARMLDVDRAVGQLRAPLYKAVHCYYRRDMGVRASALACGCAQSTFRGRLKLAWHFIDETLNP